MRGLSTMSHEASFLRGIPASQKAAVQAASVTARPLRAFSGMSLGGMEVSYH